MVQGMHSCHGQQWNTLWFTAPTSSSLLLSLLGDSGAKLPVARVTWAETSAEAGSLAVLHGWDPLLGRAMGQGSVGRCSISSSTNFGTILGLQPFSD